MEKFEHLVPYIQASIRDNWEYTAMTDFKGASFQYRDVARKIAKLHLLFEHAGLKKGDRVAVCGRNSAQWSSDAAGRGSDTKCHQTSAFQ